MVKVLNWIGADSMAKRVCSLFLAVLLILVCNFSISHAQDTRLTTVKAPVFAQMIQMVAYKAYTSGSMSKQVFIGEPIWIDGQGYYQCNFGYNNKLDDGWLKLWVDNQGYVDRITIVADGSSAKSQELLAYVLGFSAVLLGMKENELAYLRDNITEFPNGKSGMGKVYVQSMQKTVTFYMDFSKRPIFYSLYVLE